jgi:DNA invertase Pin-like site-specific DNA recombinase
VNAQSTKSSYVASGGKRVKFVVYAWADRASRSSRDFAELCDALEEAGGMMMLQGTIHDLTDPHHRFILRVQGAIAELESQMRLLRLITARGAKAQKLER